MSGEITLQQTEAGVLELAGRLGVSVTGATRLSVSDNDVWHLPEAAMVVKVARRVTPATLATMNKVVNLAQHHDVMGAPTFRLAQHDGIPTQPVNVGASFATVWQHELSARRRAATNPEVGHVLRAIHDLELPASHRMDIWNPAGVAREQVTEAEYLTDNERTYLLERCDVIEAQVQAIPEERNDCVVHGDCHRGNVFRRSNNTVLLGDFDAASIGPRVADCEPLLTGALHYGRNRASALQAFVYGYGTDRELVSSDLVPLIVEAGELRVTCGGLHRMANSAVADEVRKRIACMQGASTDRWIAFAELERTTPAAGTLDLTG